MQKTLTTAVTTLAAGLMLLGNATAQQTPDSSAAKAPAAKTQSATPAKTSTTPAAKSQGDAGLTTEKDKVSYAIGMNIGKGLHHDGVDVDPAVLTRGLKDGMAGGKTAMTDEEAKAAMMTLQAGLRKKQEAQKQVEGAANEKEGAAFLAANKAKPGVVTLPSGLQYKILKEGTGPKPTASDTVACNYKGTLINGTEFDSSYKRGQPATFPVGQVIKGWTEALQLMPVGSKWQISFRPTWLTAPRVRGTTLVPIRR
jgi:FKBP-type peptidyl-prolyl cis-trans isomerase FklB